MPETIYSGGQPAFLVEAFLHPLSLKCLCHLTNLLVNYSFCILLSVVATCDESAV